METHMMTYDCAKCYFILYVFVLLHVPNDARISGLFSLDFSFSLQLALTFIHNICRYKQHNYNKALQCL